MFCFFFLVSYDGSPFEMTVNIFWLFSSMYLIQKVKIFMQRDLQWKILVFSPFPPFCSHFIQLFCFTNWFFYCCNYVPIDWRPLAGLVCVLIKLCCVAQPHVLLTVAHSAGQDVQSFLRRHFWGHQRPLDRWRGAGSHRWRGRALYRRNPSALEDPRAYFWIVWSVDLSI